MIYNRSRSAEICEQIDFCIYDHSRESCLVDDRPVSKRTGRIRAIQLVRGQFR